MELMLWRLQKTTSSIMSCSVMARPRSASNSWRSAPLNTMRLPLMVRMPSSMRKRRKPTFWDVHSMTSPAWSMTSTSSSYSVGLSALQGAMPCSGPLEIAVCASASPVVCHTVLPSASFRVARTVAASAALSTVSAASREAVPASGSQSASICVFSMCTCGRAASSTERNRPCRRQKS